MPAAREQESILICTQCGHINPATNKFCGNCGNGLVSLFDAPPSKPVDNRKVVDPGEVKMPDFGNFRETKAEVPPQHNFPEARAQERAEVRQSELRQSAAREPELAHADVRPSVPPREPRRDFTSEPNFAPEYRNIAPEPRTVAPDPRRFEPRRVQRDEPVTPISGPSFLGLSSDPLDTPDYLLEDEPRRGGAFRFLMFLAIIALVVVGALEWRAIRKMVAEQSARLQGTPAAEQQAPSASSSDATPPVATDGQTAVAPPAATSPSAGTPADIQQQHPLVEMDLPPQGQQPLTPTVQPPQPNAAAPSNQVAPTPQSVPSPAPLNTGSPVGQTPAPQDPGASVKPGVPTIQRSSNAPAKTLAASTTPKKVPEPVQEKLDPARDPNVLAAEKYLYGPSRNCVAARKLLEEAATRQNPSAMSHLGAMYATGQCVSANKTLAYIWFSRAYDVTPENHWLEKNLTMLWRDMSSSERQVVLKAKSGR